eukprot:311541-Pelagomonas_calceolata.AAC.1
MHTVTLLAAAGGSPPGSPPPLPAPGIAHKQQPLQPPWPPPPPPSPQVLLHFCPVPAPATMDTQASQPNHSRIKHHPLNSHPGAQHRSATQKTLSQGKLHVLSPYCQSMCYYRACYHAMCNSSATKVNQSLTEIGCNEIATAAALLRHPALHGMPAAQRCVRAGPLLRMKCFAAPHSVPPASAAGALAESSSPADTDRKQNEERATSQEGQQAIALNAAQAIVLHICSLNSSTSIALSLLGPQRAMPATSI